jgi:hypothetical protein
MSLSDFIAALLKNETARWSHTKLWANVAYLTATGCVIWYAFNSWLSADMLGLYLGVVAGHNVASKFLTLREDAAAVQTAQQQEGNP